MEQNTVILDAADVLHIPGLSFDGLVGMSPIAACRNAVGAGLAADEYSSKYYANGAAPMGILETPTLIKNPEFLRQSWNEAFGGSRNAGKVAVLEQGTTFKPISLSPQDSQLLETRKFSVEEICRIFRVPPHMVQNLERATFNNTEQMSLDFVMYSLTPWIIRWEQSLSRSLLSREEKKQYSIRFNVDGLLRGDYKSRMEGYAVGINNGFMCPNDVRRLEGFDLIPAEKGGDNFLIQGAMVKLEDAGIYAEKKETK
jgi:HK97 family phage portal protein